MRVPGNLIVSGSISKGSGSFKIDPPLDPQNKYLSHSFVESPDMMNVYNGNITTNEQGEATVTLPAYFEALNRDFRYQLTVIGQFAQAILLEKVKGNQFKRLSRRESLQSGGTFQITPFNLFDRFWTPELFAPSEQFSATTYSVFANGGKATLTVTRTGENGGVDSVQ